MILYENARLFCPSVFSQALNLCRPFSLVSPCPQFSTEKKTKSLQKLWPSGRCVTSGNRENKRAAAAHGASFDVSRGLPKSVLSILHGNFQTSLTSSLCQRRRLTQYFKYLNIYTPLTFYKHWRIGTLTAALTVVLWVL